MLIFKSAELTAFLCHLRRIVGPTTADVDNKGIVDGLWRGEISVHSPNKRRMHICGFWFGGRCIGWLHQEGTTLPEVEHDKAHRAKKERQEMTCSERFVAEGNERADQLARDGAMLDGGEMAQIRASTFQQHTEQPAKEEAGGDWDEEQRNSGNREHGPPRSRGSGCFCFLILPSSWVMVQVRATEVNSTRQEEDRRTEVGSHHRKETINSTVKNKISVATWRIVNGRCCTPAEILKTHINRQGKDPST